jgi:hypothetical protein
MLPTPVEVHKFPGGPWPIDLASTGGHIDPNAAGIINGADSPVPSPGTVTREMSSAGSMVLPLGLHPDLAAAAAGLLMHRQQQQQHMLGDSFDDDTVVSFDDLSEVMVPCSGSGSGLSGTTSSSGGGHQNARFSYVSSGRHDDLIFCGSLDAQRQSGVSMFGAVDGGQY